MTATVAPTVHRIPRGTYSVGGFEHPDRAGGYVQRVHPLDDGSYVRLMVEGHEGVGFGLTAVDEDLHYNLGPGLGTASGPYVGAYGLAGVIDNRGGTAREIDEARASGRLIEARVGDLLEVDGRLWRIDWYRRASWVDRHNVELHPAGPPCRNCRGPLGEDNVDDVCGPCAERLR